MTVEAVYDTAGGAKLVAEQKLAGAAALASRRAAEVFGLEVLQEAVQDYEFNITRFAIIGGTPAAGRQQDHGGLRAAEHPGRAVQGAERVRAARDQPVEARKPSAARPAVGVPVLHRGGRARRRARVRRGLTQLGDFAQMLRVLGTYKGAERRWAK